MVIVKLIVVALTKLAVAVAGTASPQETVVWPKSEAWASLLPSLKVATRVA